MTATSIPDLDSFRAFFLEEFEARVSEIEKTDRIPEELVRRTAEIGTFKLTIPEEWGGFGMKTADYQPYLEAAAMGTAPGGC